MVQQISYNFDATHLIKKMNLNMNHNNLFSILDLESS